MARRRRGCASAGQDGFMSWPVSLTKTRTPRSRIGRGCSFMAAKIRRRARRRDARSATWWLAARSLRASAFMCGRAWRWGGRAICFCLRKSELAKVTRCARRGQHRSCGKRTAFPAVMHTLSTEIHQCKWCHVFTLANFHLFHAGFHAEFRLSHSLFPCVQVLVVLRSIEKFNRQVCRSCPRLSNAI